MGHDALYGEAICYIHEVTITAGPQSRYVCFLYELKIYDIIGIPLIIKGVPMHQEFDHHQIHQSQTAFRAICLNEMFDCIRISLIIKSSMHTHRNCCNHSNTCWFIGGHYFTCQRLIEHVVWLMKCWTWGYRSAIMTYPCHFEGM